MNTILFILIFNSFTFALFFIIRKNMLTSKYNIFWANGTKINSVDRYVWYKNISYMQYFFAAIYLFLATFDSLGLIKTFSHQTILILNFIVFLLVLVCFWFYVKVKISRDYILSKLKSIIHEQEDRIKYIAKILDPHEKQLPSAEEALKLYQENISISKSLEKNRKILRNI